MYLKHAKRLIRKSFIHLWLETNSTKGQVFRPKPAIFIVVAEKSDSKSWPELSGLYCISIRCMRILNRFCSGHRYPQPVFKWSQWHCQNQCVSSRSKCSLVIDVKKCLETLFLRIPRQICTIRESQSRCPKINKRPWVSKKVP